MNRVMPDRLREAYANTGAKPSRGYMNFKGMCCGIGALALDAGVSRPEAKSIDQIARALLLKTDYVIGFINGFDDGVVFAEADRDRELLRLGREDGRSCRIAVGA